jgi:8-oxo-dGTP pyrophosphatase MutT (NUDIX family)
MNAVVAHPAATVLLLRDDPRGVAVYLQRRRIRLGFAGGLWAFPGGRVDDADGDPAIDDHWSGPSPKMWARRLDLDLATARAFVVAACRETLEEAGVLLADPVPQPQRLADARDSLLSGVDNLAGVLSGLGVRLATDRLRYWAWWVTPDGEPRRYDTRFFLASPPPGVSVTAHPGEVLEERWVTPPISGQLPMLPPTYYTLRDVFAHTSTAAALDAGIARPVERIQPVLDGDDILLPWDDRYPLPTRRDAT